MRRRRGSAATFLGLFSCLVLALQHLASPAPFALARFERDGQGQEVPCTEADRVAALIERARAYEGKLPGNGGGGLDAEVWMRRARECYTIAVAKDPANRNARIGLAKLHSRGGDHRACVDVLTARGGSGASLFGDDPWVHFFIGLCSLHLQDIEVAEGHLMRAAGGLPRLVSAQFHHGLSLTHLGEYERAAGAYERALAVEPGHLHARVNLGGVYFGMGEYDSAAAAFREALASDGGRRDAGTWENLASALAKGERWGEAAAAYDAALRLDSGNVKLMSLRQHCRQMGCDWREWAADLTLVKDLIAVGSAHLVSPFNALTLPIAPLSQLRVARAKAAAIAAAYRGQEEKEQEEDQREEIGEGRRRGARSDPAAPAPLSERRRLKIAYVSQDFRSHPVGYLFEPFLASHDTSRFEVFAYAINPPEHEQGEGGGGSQRERIERAVEHFVTIHGMEAHAVIAELVRDGIDVVVNLGGYTLSNRNDIFVPDLAAVKVLYAGYPGTLGFRNVDYIVTDPFSTPIAGHAHFTEKFANTRVTFHPMHHRSHYVALPADEDKGVGEGEGGREAYGLPREGVVFCCFNTPYKIDPVTFRHWMSILSKVENSVLWLASASGEIEENLKREAGKFAGRLRWLGWLSQGEHLRAKAHCNVFLDTPNYGAHMTAGDALWAGVPIVSKPGQTMASRLCGAILMSAVGGGTLVPSMGEYEARAVELALNATAYEAARALASRARESPLYDIARKVGEVETLFGMMHDLNAAGYGPFHLFLANETGAESEVEEWEPSPPHKGEETDRSHEEL